MRLFSVASLCGLMVSLPFAARCQTATPADPGHATPADPAHAAPIEPAHPTTVEPAHPTMPKSAAAVDQKGLWLKANGFFAEGNRFAQQKKYAEAIAKFQQAIATYPSEAHYHFNLALAYKHKGELQQAADEFKKTTELRHTDWRAWKGLANTYYKLSRFGEAREAFEQALQNNPPQNEVGELKAGMAFSASKASPHN